MSPQRDEALGPALYPGFDGLASLGKSSKLEDGEVVSGGSAIDSFLEAMQPLRDGTSVLALVMVADEDGLLRTRFVTDHAAPAEFRAACIKSMHEFTGELLSDSRVVDVPDATPKKRRKARDKA